MGAVDGCCAGDGQLYSPIKMLFDCFQFCPAFMNRALRSCRLVPTQTPPTPVLLIAAVVPGGILAQKTVAFCD